MPIEELPRNPSGKVLKTKLREYDLSGREDSGAADRCRLIENLPLRHSRRCPPDACGTTSKAAYATNRPQVALEFVQDLVQVLSGQERSSIPTRGFWRRGSIR